MYIFVNVSIYDDVGYYLHFIGIQSFAQMK